MKHIKIGNKETTLEEALAKFQRRNEVKNLSQSTINFYEEKVNHFIDFIDNKQYINEVTEEDIKNYILDLKGRVKDTTVNIYLRGVRAFLYYCMDNNMVDQFEISMLKTDREKKEGYTIKQLNKLLDKPNMKHFGEYRNWVVVNMLVATGCRTGTLVELKVKDVNLEEETIKFRRTKGRRQIRLPLTKTMLNILKEYLSIREWGKEDYLFPNIYGEKLSKSGLRTAIQRYNTKRGVSDTSIHKFRHTFSKIFIKNGGSIYELKQILGHKKISTTENYVNLLLDDYEEDFSSKNPLEVLKGNKNKIKMDRD